MKKNLKFTVAKKINLLTFFFFLYAIVNTCIPSPTFFKSNHDLKLNPNWKIINGNSKKNEADSIAKMLEDKIDVDLILHRMEALNKETTMTQVNLNKEGKILGYKPYNLKLVNYLLEFPMTNLIKKNTEIMHKYVDIYWLNLKVK